MDAACWYYVFFKTLLLPVFWAVATLSCIFFGFWSYVWDCVGYDHTWPRWSGGCNMTLRLLEALESLVNSTLHSVGSWRHLVIWTVRQYLRNLNFRLDSKEELKLPLCLVQAWIVRRYWLFGLFRDTDVSAGQFSWLTGDIPSRRLKKITLTCAWTGIYKVYYFFQYLAPVNQLYFLVWEHG